MGAQLHTPQLASCRLSLIHGNNNFILHFAVDLNQFGKTQAIYNSRMHLQYHANNIPFARSIQIILYTHLHMGHFGAELSDVQHPPAMHCKHLRHLVIKIKCFVDFTITNTWITQF